MTNGTKLFVDGAHEGPWARRFRDLVQLHEEDLGPHETLSELQRSLCRRVATLEVELEQMEGKLSKGEEVDLELYRALTGTLSRVGTSLGVKRIAKPSGPKSVAEYAAMKRPGHHAVKPLFTLREALDDPHLLGGLLDGPSWRYWRALLIAAMGEELTDDERTLFREITGREREPGQRVEELWGVIGRRGGKTRAMSCLAAYIAACCDWTGLLAPGETGILALFAATQRQAEVALSYIAAIFADLDRPLLHGMWRNETQELVELDNSGSKIAVEVRPASVQDEPRHLHHRHYL